jgi:hypothetical protein
MPYRKQQDRLCDIIGDILTLSSGDCQGPAMKTDQQKKIMTFPQVLYPVIPEAVRYSLLICFCGHRGTAFQNGRNAPFGLGIRRAEARSLSVTSRQEIWDNFINN